MYSNLSLYMQFITYSVGLSLTNQAISVYISIVIIIYMILQSAKKYDHFSPTQAISCVRGGELGHAEMYQSALRRFFAEDRIHLSCDFRYLETYLYLTEVIEQISLHRSTLILVEAQATPRGTTCISAMDRLCNQVLEFNHRLTLLPVFSVDLSVSHRYLPNGEIDENGPSKVLAEIRRRNNEVILIDSKSSAEDIQNNINAQLEGIMEKTLFYAVR